MVYIIMPAFNAEKYIKKTIKSIIKQNYEDWKLIIVEDGSTDNTYRICFDFSKSDNRILLIKNNGKGAYSARLNGIEYCKRYAQDDDLVAFIDSDDLFSSKNAIESMVSNQKKYDADIIVGGNKRFYGDSIKIKINGFSLSNRLFTKRQINDELFISFYGLFTGMPLYVWGKLYKFKTICNILDYDKHPYFFADDQFVNLIAFENAEKLVTIEDNVYLYRIGGNTSGFMPSFFSDMLFMYDFRKSLLAKHKIPQDALLYMRIEYKNVLYYWLCSCLNKGNYSDDKMLAEIEKCLKLEQTNDAFSDERVLNMETVENQKKFITSVIQQKPQEILSILKSEPKPPTLFQRAIKKIFR